MIAPNTFAPFHVETESPEQTWTIRTTMQADNEDNDQLSFVVNTDTYYHDEWLNIEDWRMHGEEIIEVEHDTNGRLRMVVFESFGQQFDRSSEEFYAVVWTRHIERS